MVVAIIDQFPILRSGLKYFLEDHFTGSSIVEYGRVIDIKKKPPELAMDLIIFGLNHNDTTNSILMIRELKSFFPLVKIIGYDEKSVPFMVPNYLNAGCSGYLSKQADLQHLIKCIRDVLSSKQHNTQKMKNLVLEDSYTSANRLKPEIRLTPQEYQVAKYLCEGKSTTWIAREMLRSISTISTIKFRVFRKLHIDNIIMLIDQIENVTIKFRK